MGVRDDVFALAEPIVQSLGYELVDVEYAKEGPRWFLRVFLTGKEGISLEDCRRVNDALGPVIEEKDPVKTPYFLEVSSPGAERVLKSEREYRIFQGRLVKVSLREAEGGLYAHFGRLGPATEESLVITDSATGDPRSISRSNIKQVRLALQSSVPVNQ